MYENTNNTRGKISLPKATTRVAIHDPSERRRFSMIRIRHRLLLNKRIRNLSGRQNKITVFFKIQPVATDEIVKVQSLAI